MRIIIVILAVSFLLYQCKTENTTAEKKEKYLELLKSLPDKKEKKIITGQFACWGKYSYKAEIDTIFLKSGQWLGMLGIDYHCLDMTTKTPPGLEKVISISNQMVSDYGVPLCNMCMSLNNPFNDSSLFSVTGDIKLLSEKQHPAHRNLLRQLDTMAAGIKELETKGILVMLRPYHEMNGNWFWWGNKNPEDYINLWRLTHQYLSDDKKLKNIIWCYSPNIGDNYRTYYPGDDYVDVVCIDIYTPNLKTDLKASYDSLTAFNKPFGLGEYGCITGGDWWWSTHYIHDYHALLEALHHYPKITFFLTWNLHWGLTRHNGLEILKDPVFINREEIKRIMQ